MITTCKSNRTVTGLAIMLAAGALLMSGIAAQADTLYNLAVGQNRNGGYAITPANDVRGPADLITANQTWNCFSQSLLTGTLKTSAGTVTTKTFTSSNGTWASNGGTGSRIFEAFLIS